MHCSNLSLFFIRPLKTLKVKNDFYIFPLGADVAPDNIYSFF